MITLKEAKELQYSIRNTIVDLVLHKVEVKDYMEIIGYVKRSLSFIEQQEKVTKLLDLYRKAFTKNISNTVYEEWIILESQIKALEEELK